MDLQVELWQVTRRSNDKDLSLRQLSHVRLVWRSRRRLTGDFAAESMSRVV
ncbi:hypothetical protein F2Q69_00019024 [Brassica cretica]|uniref:Uncharacterized protein n=1 Tax=Brassica cretica TaxID=69181 RepID=A0A8S9Q782_BRACR|nr:hypothetical protein F2Q69_00019024 [Brassica cretica]